MQVKLPDSFRYAQRAAGFLGLRFEDLDNGGGYLFRISSGQKSIVLGAGRLNPYPLNSAASTAISKDKDFTNRLLSQAGIPNLGGRAFFLSDLHRRLRGDGFEVDDARQYLEDLGFPCFCKPLSGSQGDFAERINSLAQFDRYVERVLKKHDSIIVQKIFSGDEYRVFVLDGEAWFCLRKADQVIRGDGQTSVGEFIAEINARLTGTGISLISDDETLTTTDGRSLERSEVPQDGMQLVLGGRRNFSVTQEVGVLLEPVPKPLAEIACAATSCLGLRLAGVDLFASLGEPTPSIRVIEVNGKPGIHSLEALGRWDLLDRIWTTILQKSFSLDEAC